MNPTPQPLWQIILSLGVAGSVVGALLSWLGDRFRRRAELKRWRAEFYLRPKLEALRKMHETMVKAHYGINRRAASVSLPKTIEEYQNGVVKLEADFFDAYTLAAVYLTPSQQDTMREFLGCLRQMSTSIWTRLPESEVGALLKEQPEFQPFHSSYDRAHILLTNLLNPDLLKEVEN